MNLQALPDWVYCPHCRFAFSARVKVGESGHPDAPAWEINICTACGEPSMFTPDRGALRALTDEELALLSQDPAFVLALGFAEKSVAERRKAGLN